MMGSQPQKAVELPPTLIVEKFVESRASELKSLQSIVANRLNNDFRSQRNKRRRTTSYKNRGGKRQKVSNNKGLETDSKACPRRIRRRIELKKNPETGFITSGDGTKRLRTHIWHAKRFTMTKLWGFHLPLHLQGSGKGSRALLKKVKNGVVVHDASYNSAVQLEGPQEVLLSVLDNLFVPSPSRYSEITLTKIISGVIYGSAMLHHGGDPFSPCIAPVTYMWQPIKDQNVNSDNEQQIVENCALTRKLWIWIHPAGFKEGYETLKCACDLKTDESGCLVKCTSLEDQLAKIEIMGAKTIELLQKTLHPITCEPLPKCSTTEFNGETSSFLENEDEISISSVISLIVKDPRTLTKDNTHVHEGAFFGNKENVRNLHENINLWDFNKGVCPPIEESIICNEKHHQNLEFCRIIDKNSEKPDSSVNEHYSKFCPVLLLKNNNHGGSLTRWSIILPLNWVKTFWVPLISNGGHAIGLREKHWISCDIGLPCFPLDFPDSNSYSSFMETIELKAPFSSPWKSIRVSFDKIIKDQVKIQDECNKKDESKNGFGGFVIRTSYTMSNYLNQINGDSLLLFPGQKKFMFKSMNDEKKIDYNPPIYSREKLCFVRVVLNAFKEGVFEEGAVICAPCVEDILSWTVRSNEENRHIQVAQSSLESYFIQDLSGEWVVHEPKDDLDTETHRWPIGFVTTGFVKGSKKGVAVGICEAMLLACLRKGQWEIIKRKRKEIYVLVRNLRSTSYRLALATIVLEEYQEDVEYI